MSNNKSILVLPGDGIGPEVMAPAVELARLAARDEGVTLEISEALVGGCLLYTSPSPRDLSTSRMPSSA